MVQEKSGVEADDADNSEGLPAEGRSHDPGIRTLNNDAAIFIGGWVWNFTPIQPWPFVWCLVVCARHGIGEGERRQCRPRREAATVPYSIGVRGRACFAGVPWTRALTARKLRR